jgi:hypothetical protein
MMPGAESIATTPNRIQYRLKRAIAYFFAPRDRKSNFDTTVLARALPAFELVFVDAVGRVD